MKIYKESDCRLSSINIRWTPSGVIADCIGMRGRVEHVMLSWVRSSQSSAMYDNISKKFPILLETVLQFVSSFKMGGLSTKIFRKGNWSWRRFCRQVWIALTGAFHRNKTILLVYFIIFSKTRQTSLTCLCLMSQMPIFILLGMSNLGEILTQQMSRTLNVEVVTWTKLLQAAVEMFFVGVHYIIYSNLFYYE